MVRRAKEVQVVAMVLMVWTAWPWRHHCSNSRIGLIGTNRVIQNVEKKSNGESFCPVTTADGSYNARSMTFKLYENKKSTRRIFPKPSPFGRSIDRSVGRSARGAHVFHLVAVGAVTAVAVVVATTSHRNATRAFSIMGVRERERVL
jgi:hypothetical protein